MPDQRDEFTFNVGNFGDVSAEDIIDAGESFLSADPEDIIPVKKTEEKKTKETEEQKKDKPEVKEVVIPKKEVKDDDILSALEDKTEEVEEEDNEVKPSEKKASKQAPPNTPPPKEEEEVEGDNVFTTIAKELVSLGIFTPDEDEEGKEIDLVIDSPEAFAERFQTESRRQAADVIDKFLERFGPEYKDMFENVFVKGVLPQDYLGRFSKIENIKEVDLADEGNQERIVRELLKAEGRSSEYIEKRITQLKNYSDLADEATEAQKVLIQREEKAIQAAAAIKQQELVNKQRIRTEYLNGVARIIQDKLKSKEFDGIPIDKKFADETMTYITEERYQTSDKQLLTEFDKDLLDLNIPQNHPLKVKVAMLLQLLKTDPQLTKLAKKAVSKETNSLFQGLKKTVNKTSSKNTKEEIQENSWD
jgi:hypothetical protein